MHTTWSEDDAVIQSLDDAILAFKPHVDDVLDRLLPHVSTPSDELDLFIFGVLGNFTAGYHFARSELESPTDAFHRGISAVLANESVARMVRSMIQNGADKMVRERT
jgi:hypothetical protein